MLEYSEFVTKLNTTSGTGVADLDHHTLSLSAEAGELAGKVSKKLYRGQHYTAEEYLSELGDVLFHVQALCNYFNVTLLEVAHANQYKLINRVAAGTLHGDGDNR